MNFFLSIRLVKRTLLDIFPIPGKSMNHKYIFVNKYLYNHDNETFTKNQSETKNECIQYKQHYNIILINY